MTSRWESFSATDLGKRLKDAIDKPERAIEYRLLSRLRMAAVYAIIEDVRPIFDGLEQKERRDEASQFCGWLVGQQMRSMGYSIADSRGRVRDAPFKTGATWTNRAETKGDEAND